MFPPGQLPIYRHLCEMCGSRVIKTAITGWNHVKALLVHSHSLTDETSGPNGWSHLIAGPSRASQGFPGISNGSMDDMDGISLLFIMSSSPSPIKIIPNMSDNPHKRCGAITSPVGISGTPIHDYIRRNTGNSRKLSIVQVNDMN